MELLYGPGIYHVATWTHWVTWCYPGVLILKHIPGCSYGPPQASLKGSELQASVLKVVCNGVPLGLDGFRINGPY